jgi:hypothetical protein
MARARSLPSGPIRSARCSTAPRCRRARGAHALGERDWVEGRATRGRGARPLRTGSRARRSGRRAPSPRSSASGRARAARRWRSSRRACPQRPRSSSRPLIICTSGARDDTCAGLRRADAHEPSDFAGNPLERNVQQCARPMIPVTRSSALWVLAAMAAAMGGPACFDPQPDPPEDAAAGAGSPQGGATGEGGFFTGLGGAGGQPDGNGGSPAAGGGAEGGGEPIGGGVAAGGGGGGAGGGAGGGGASEGGASQGGGGMGGGGRRRWRSRRRPRLSNDHGHGQRAWCEGFDEVSRVARSFEARRVGRGPRAAGVRELVRVRSSARSAWPR